MLISEFQLDFSYISFSVYDSGVLLPGNETTEDHFNQGFARRDSSINVRTLLEFGVANVRVFEGDFIREKADERAIVVPFYCPTGKVFVDGPEESEPHSFNVEPGHYQLAIAQQANYEEGSQLIRLYFCKVEKRLNASRIIIKDQQLNPPSKLLETAEIAKF